MERRCNGHDWRAVRSGLPVVPGHRPARAERSACVSLRPCVLRVLSKVCCVLVLLCHTSHVTRHTHLSVNTVTYCIELFCPRRV